jgi:hypothetical protein
MLFSAIFTGGLKCRQCNLKNLITPKQRTCPTGQRLKLSNKNTQASQQSLILSYKKDFGCFRNKALQNNNKGVKKVSFTYKHSLM